MALRIYLYNAVINDAFGTYAQSLTANDDGSCFRSSLTTSSIWRNHCMALGITHWVLFVHVAGSVTASGDGAVSGQRVHQSGAALLGNL